VEDKNKKERKRREPKTNPKKMIEPLGVSSTGLIHLNGYSLSLLYLIVLNSILHHFFVVFAS